MKYSGMTKPERFKKLIRKRNNFVLFVKTIRANKKDYIFNMGKRLNIDYRTCQDI